MTTTTYKTNTTEIRGEIDLDVSYSCSYTEEAIQNAEIALASGRTIQDERNDNISAGLENLRHALIYFDKSRE